MGDFVIELLPDRAPLTVANFLRYVNEGFYSNTLIHRVVANFVIQGGGHAATDPYELKPLARSIDNESGNGLQNKRGTVGLARAAGAHSGNAQFYINLVDNPDLDPLPTRWGYAVFGRVVQGMDVVDRIGVDADGCLRAVQVRCAAEAGRHSERRAHRLATNHDTRAKPAARRTAIRHSAGWSPPSPSAQPGAPQSGSSPSSQPTASPQTPTGQPVAPASPPANPATPPPGSTSNKSQGTKPPPPKAPPGEADQPPPI